MKNVLVFLFILLSSVSYSQDAPKQKPESEVEVADFKDSDLDPRLIIGSLTMQINDLTQDKQRLLVERKNLNAKVSELQKQAPLIYHHEIWIVPGKSCSVTSYKHGAKTLEPAYSDQKFTIPVSNPFLENGDGHFNFYTKVEVDLSFSDGCKAH